MRCGATIRLTACAMLAARALSAQQETCRPGTDSHEAKSFAILSVPLAFSGGEAPAPLHGISLGMEVASLPGVDTVLATPTTCRPGKGPENSNPLTGLFRPRLAVGVAGFVLEASWVPPFVINGVDANLFGFAVGYPIEIGHRWTASVRAHLLVGAIHAPVVCDKTAILDPASECYQGSPSNDRWAPNIGGVEAVLGTPPGPLRFHGGLGVSRLQPRFQVDFTDAQGVRDQRKVEVNLTRASIFGGVTYQIGPVDLAAEGYATFVDAVTVRFILRAPLIR